MPTEPAYTCCGVVPLGMIRDGASHYSFDYEYTLPLCLQLAPYVHGLHAGQRTPHTEWNLVPT